MKNFWYQALALFLVFLSFFDNVSAQESKISLKGIFDESFMIGAALNYREVDGRADYAMPVLSQHFSSISPENGLKWSNIHPNPGLYDFEYGDAFIKLGAQLDAFVVGHTLAWHQQVPDWVFEKEDGTGKSKSELLATLEEHIETVVGRYRGKVHGWDVVNEAIEDSGEFRKSKWFEIAGVDFIKTAFRKAHEIDPEAELYYNDYNVFNPKKRAAILELAKNMREEGIRIDGIGMQGHYMLSRPSISEIEKGIIEIYEAGFQVMITELDVDVLKRPKEAIGADLTKSYEFQEEFNPYSKGLPEEVEAQLSQRYREIFELYHRHKDKITRVTFWGIHDGVSWLNNWPVRGRTNYPLIFDRSAAPKQEIFNALKEISGN